jgi:hypothetical protein
VPLQDDLLGGVRHAQRLGLRQCALPLERPYSLAWRFRRFQIRRSHPQLPFKVENGILAIEVSKGPDGKWQSGLLSSTDPEGHGYAQQYGYFEARAKIPPGPGVWPAFWLTTNQPKTVPEPGVEFDMMEYYGRAPDEFKSTIHVWYKGDEKSKTRHEGMKTKVPSGSLSEDFHLYGIDIAADWTVYYLDRKEIGRMKTPVEHKKPLTILVNLGLGPGWPIDKTPNPSFFYVDYVRAYERDDQKAASCGAAAH